MESLDSATYLGSVTSTETDPQASAASFLQYVENQDFTTGTYCFNLSMFSCFQSDVTENAYAILVSKHSSRWLVAKIKLATLKVTILGLGGYPGTVYVSPSLYPNSSSPTGNN